MHGTASFLFGYCPTLLEPSVKSASALISGTSIFIGDLTVDGSETGWPKIKANEISKGVATTSADARHRG